MKKVIVESPYGSEDPKQVQYNTRYARAALRDCLQREEAPFASHLLYTQRGVLQDELPEERKLGIEAGLVWGRSAEATVVYCDLGITEGMLQGINRARSEGRKLIIRSLVEWKTEDSPKFYECACKQEGVCGLCGGWGWLNADHLNEAAKQAFEKEEVV